MKVYFCLTIWREHGDRQVFDHLISVCSSGFAKCDGIFEVQFVLPDEREQRLLSILQEAGYQPERYCVARGPKQYQLIYRRQYDETDWEAAEWLQPMICEEFEQVFADRRSDGVLEIEPRFFKRSIVLYGGLSPYFIVSRQVRSWLEEGGLRGMVIRPTAKVKGRGAADESNLWELTTEVVLPPMSSKMTFLDAEGNPTQAGQEGGFSQVEEFFIPVEFHYTRSAMEQAKDADLALTWEHFGMPGPGNHYPELLVSKRFYEVCKLHGLKMDWIPVRIDPE